ncbi:MAG: radical SAM protein [Deltaproteobacteria bacterium]
MKDPLVSIIVVNYNGKRFLQDCLRSLLAQNYGGGIEILLVDNGSTDGSVELVRSDFPSVQVLIHPENNYVKANNFAVSRAKGELIAFVNNDIVAGPDWLAPLVRCLLDDKALGGAGSKILFMDGRIQSLGLQEIPGFYFVDRERGAEDTGTFTGVLETGALCGCAALYRRSCLDAVGPLDEDFVMFVEDVDLGLRCAQKGWKLAVCADSVIRHHCHGTVGSEKEARGLIERNRLLLIAKHWPDKLADSLMGGGFYTAYGAYGARDISDVIGKVYAKLVKEHGIAKAEFLAPSVFNSIRLIYTYEKQRLLGDLNGLESALHEKEERLKGERAALDSLRNSHHETCRDLDETGHRLEETAHRAAELAAEVDRKSAVIAEKEKELKQVCVEAEAVALSLRREIDGARSSAEALKAALEKQTDHARTLEAALEKQTERARMLEEALEKQTERARTLEEAGTGLKKEAERLRESLQEKEAQLQQRQIEAEDKNMLLERTRAELDSIHDSTGYKYFLKPAWDVIYPLKRSVRGIASLDFRRSVCLIAAGLGSLARRAVCRAGSLANRARLRSLSPAEGREFQAHLSSGAFPASPERVVIMINSECNLRCAFCGIPGRYEKRRMTLPEMRLVLEQAAALGTKEVVFTGGEPLLHPDLFSAVEYAHSLGLRTALTTNGVLLRKLSGRIARSALDTVSVSVDGFKETHARLRNHEMAYDEIISSMEDLKRTGLGVTANFVITARNIGELPALYEFLTAKGIYVSFFPVQFVDAKELFPSREQLGIFMAFVRKLFSKGRIDAAAFHYYDEMCRYFLEPGHTVRCLGLYREYGVDVNGELLPCCVWSNPQRPVNGLGNVHMERHLERFWHSQKALEARRSLYREGCGKCFNMSLAEFTRVTGRSFVMGRETALQAKGTGISPVHVHIRPTLRCNFSCRHCDIWKSPSPEPELTLDQWKAVIDKLGSWLGAFRMDVAGGEILLRKDIYDIIGHAVSRGASVNLTTNGSLITEDTAAKIVSCGFAGVSLSLDGATARTHDYIRNRQGGFDTIMRNARLLRESRGPAACPAVTCASVITSGNLDELADIVKFAGEVFDSVTFQALDNNFHAAFDPAWFRKNEFWPKDAEKAIRAIDGLITLKHEGRRINNSVYQLETMKKYYADPSGCAEYPCKTGESNFIVTETGKVRLCWNLGDVGDILREDPCAIWSGKKARAMRQTIAACRKTCRLLNCNSF